MVKLTIDDKEIDVERGLTVLQACEIAGVEIPRFCYHERLSIAGNCRMCLVEMEKSPKPIASCAMPAGEGMVIRTNSAVARKARQGVMEFLLINHPLDCPICDQGGECDLQDQAMAYGGDRTRYHENKRAVKDKYMGPLIKTIMTRCIHCTRCIRFATEVAGVPELGAVNRGEHMEITTYLEKTMTSEMSGNVIDLCPVGALTSKPYAFSARSWELTKTESIDVMDAVGSNIRVDSRGGAVMRVLPRLNEDINEEWISDKTRFACDGLLRQRLDRPYVRREGKLQEASWTEAFTVIATRLKEIPGDRVAAIAGDQADVEAMYALKDLMAVLGSPHLDCRQDGAWFDPSRRENYIFNTTIAGIEQADACLMVAADPRHEAPIIEARLRKRWLMGGFGTASIGPDIDHTFPVLKLGAGPETLLAVLDGTADFARILESAERPMLILGQGALARADGAAVYATATQIAEKYGVAIDGWNGFNVLHTAAARVGGLDIGFLPRTGGRDVSGILAGAGAGEIGAVYLLGADEIDMNALGEAFVIYQGHHGDAGAHRADVILPGAAYTEKSATYVNTEGRLQMTEIAVFPPGDAREDWTIIRALSEPLGHKLPFDNLDQLRALMFDQDGTLFGMRDNEEVGGSLTGPAAMDASTPFQLPIRNFYMTCPVSRASETMAQCAAELGIGPDVRTGTDG
ncbi:MAG: NADH-quinone oxidoreductase subunit G [Alphaproteobacteria bacterium]|nr:NADH-quinone oxidoreductase subunit G [Alphaproteobacteria bacterium]